jgi:hypothetical protein
MSKTVVEAAPGVIVRFPRESAVHNRGLVLVGEGAIKDRDKDAPVEVEVDQFVRGRLRAGDLIRPLAPVSSTMASSPRNTITAEK